MQHQILRLKKVRVIKKGVQVLIFKKIVHQKNSIKKFSISMYFTIHVFYINFSLLIPDLLLSWPVPSKRTVSRASVSFPLNSSTLNQKTSSPEPDP